MFQDGDDESFGRFDVGVLIILFFIFSIVLLFTILPSTKSPEPSQKNNLSRNHSYPVHPSLENCRNVEDPLQRRFCLADAAEMKENVSICEKIGDEYKYIRKFCIARITLNETMCGELNDKKLEQSCLESINLKEKWLNQSKTNK